MKYALVTGGSRGIGREICQKISELGYYVFINYATNQTEAEKTLSLIIEKGGNGEIIKFDVSNKEQIDSVLCNRMDNLKDGYIEVLVNNAGIRKDNLMMFMQDAEWNNVIDTNLTGVFYISRRIIKDMLINKFGRIVNVVSLSGLKGLPGQTNYSAAKAGVIGITKALAQEVAKKNVTVNAVAPGFIKTDMTKDLDEKTLKSLVPMNRFGEAEEVADVVAFLASKKASYITGEVISVNGGLYT